MIITTPTFPSVINHHVNTTCLNLSSLSLYSVISTFIILLHSTATVYELCVCILHVHVYCCAKNSCLPCAVLRYKHTTKCNVIQCVCYVPCSVLIVKMTQIDAFESHTLLCINVYVHVQCMCTCTMQCTCMCVVHVEYRSDAR